MCIYMCMFICETVLNIIFPVIALVEDNSRDDSIVYLVYDVSLNV